MVYHGEHMPKDNERLLSRITVDEKVMAGKPVVKGTRLTVQFILGLLAEGSTVEDVLGEYEGLTREDVMACFYYASRALDRPPGPPLGEEA